MRRSLVVLALVALFAAGVLWLAGLPARSSLEPHALADRLRNAGPLGVMGLLALLIVQCVVSPIPSEPFMMAAGYTYGPRAGFSLSWAGVCAGATLCFLLARRFGRPLAERLVRRDRLAALDGRLAERGVAVTFFVVFGLRVLSFSSFDVLSYACGLVRFPLPLFLIATGLGAVPKVFAFTYAGATAAARPGWLDGVILAGTFGTLILIPWLLARARGSTRDFVSGRGRTAGVQPPERADASRPANPAPQE